VSLDDSALKVPWSGARKLARSLQGEVRSLQEKGALLDEKARSLHSECADLRRRLKETGALTLHELEQRRSQLESTIQSQHCQLESDRLRAAESLKALEEQLKAAKAALVQTEELALLQEVGVYKYRHPLSDAVAYEKELAELFEEAKAMTKKDGGAFWRLRTGPCGSEAEGKAMVRDFSKVMLRAFNAEADNLVRGLKPYKLAAAIDRLEKVASTIEKLGKTMHLRISTPYLLLRKRELELTADFLQKQAEEKEAERMERERLRGMSLPLLKFSGGSVDDYAICRSS
jgi:Domain of unknown function (DUF4041)